MLFCSVAVQLIPDSTSVRRLMIVEWIRNDCSWYSRLMVLTAHWCSVASTHSCMFLKVQNFECFRCNTMLNRITNWFVYVNQIEKFFKLECCVIYWCTSAYDKCTIEFVNSNETHALMYVLGGQSKAAVGCSYVIMCMKSAMHVPVSLRPLWVIRSIRRGPLWVIRSIRRGVQSWNRSCTTLNQ